MNRFYHGKPVQNSQCTDGPNGGPCAVCAAASKLARRLWRQARRDALRADPSARPHGDMVTYRYWGCNCEACRAVAREKRYQYPSNGRPARGHGLAEPFGREWMNDSA